MATTFQFDEQAVAEAQGCDDLRALLLLEDAEFVASAYLSLLRRPADIDGLTHYTRKLRAGHTKYEVIALVLGSREGRSKGAQMPGLARAMLQYRLSRLPVLGALFRLFGNFEGYGSRDRHLRAIQQVLMRQERLSTHLQWQLLQEMQALRRAWSDTAQPGGTQGGSSRASIELIVQPKGQTPSVLARFIKLERSTAEEVLDQLAEIVKGSFEAEQLAPRRS